MDIMEIKIDAITFVAVRSLEGGGYDYSEDDGEPKMLIMC